MGLDFFLEDEQGNAVNSVPDPHNILSGLIAAGSDENTVCLRFIDPYGNTVFNLWQMEPLLSEITGLHRFAKKPEQEELLHQVEELIRQGQQRLHHYIKIYGD